MAMAARKHVAYLPFCTHGRGLFQASHILQSRAQIAISTSNSDEQWSRGPAQRDDMRITRIQFDSFSKLGP
ncbi:hypothetical protein AXG93_399s1230 [Marchantia polymorpha subsp. ruderalis]|uniref:Uncharacterized protein n=1 Tax=Marchantia polymorpha subsp. ruderalis TaxID=1480154 RepID=A0A176WJ64_MARPO|nr:hypothetical protein AXG93_399s1230 [Marchantia polymorpha subsp. ruderalis]